MIKTTNVIIGIPNSNPGEVVTPEPPVDEGFDEVDVGSVNNTESVVETNDNSISFIMLPLVAPTIAKW